MSSWRDAPLTGAPATSGGSWRDAPLAPSAPVEAPPMNLDPAEGMGPLDKLAVGAGATTQRVLDAITALHTSDEGKAKRKADRDLYQKYHPGGWATAGEIGADVALAAIPVARAGRGLTQAVQIARAGRAAPLAPLIGDIAANAAYNAATAPENRGTAAALGAGGAAVGRGLGRVMTGIVKPTDDAAALIQRGVRLTPGQTAGRDSLLNELEQKATSMPIAGYPISAARARALNDANLAAAKAVASHVDNTIKLGHKPLEAVEQVRDRISSVYDDVLPRLKIEPTNLESLTDQIYTHVPENAALVGERQTQALHNYLQRRVYDSRQLAGQGQVPGDFLKQVDSELGHYARTLAKSSNAEEKVASPMWYDAQQKWREYVMKAAAPDASDFAKLSQANAAYRELLAIEKALQSSGGETIKPRALAKTLQARGITSGDLADLSRQMDSTITGTVPDSGTASRMLLNSVPLVLGTGGVALGGPMAAAGLGAAAVLGTQTGRKALTGLTGPQKALISVLVKRGLTQEQAEEVVKVAAAQAGRAAATPR